VTAGDHELSIGGFSLLSGLSIPALRRYHESGVFLPSSVDPVTGYRRYGADQLATARAIRLLRSVDVPLDDIVVYLDQPDEDTLRTLLEAHRDRLKTRADEVAQLLTRTDHLLTKGVSMTDLQTTARVAEVTIHVRDIDAAAEFYRAVFDVEFVADEHGSPVHYHASFGEWPGDDFFMFTLWPAAEPTHDVAHIGLVVHDLDAAWARAKKAGAELVAPPEDTGGMPRNARLRDPSGNHLILYQG
jgi:DNA-binding transcriptional MerR regulator